MRQRADEEAGANHQSLGTIADMVGIEKGLN